MRPGEICMMYQYGYWAFEKIWVCVSQLSDEQFSQELDYSHGSIRNQVVHLMIATQRWFSRLKGESPPPYPLLDDFSTRAAAKSKWDELRIDSITYLESLSESDLDGVIHWRLPDRGLDAKNTRWEILLHVANHATDHRAQILVMLNQHFGIDTPEQDMLFYLLESNSV